MADTNFAALTSEQYTVWSRQFWKMARNLSFMNKFVGKGSNAMVQRITELTKTKGSHRAVITLIADLTGDGVMGDYELEGSEEELTAYDQVIEIDQIRNANRSAGRMADQKSIVNFRETSRDQLAYWAADRLDQLALLTLSGIAYTFKNTGALRAVLAAGKNFSDLAFAGDVTAPTSNRHFRWDATAGDLAAADTTAVTAADTLSYKALVLLKARAKDEYIRGIRTGDGEEVFHVFVCPRGMAKLKLDADYLANVRSALPRSSSNPLHAGTSSVMVDGLVIHEFRHVFNTSGATTGTVTEAGDPGYKWGATAAVDGQRVLLCGAQALGYADIGDAEWFEKEFDFNNKQGISISKIIGFKKPVFHSNVTGDNQDFGVICLDTAI